MGWLDVRRSVLCWPWSCHKQRKRDLHSHQLHGKLAGDLSVSCSFHRYWHRSLHGLLPVNITPCFEQEYSANSALFQLRTYFDMERAPIVRSALTQNVARTCLCPGGILCLLTEVVGSCRASRLRTTIGTTTRLLSQIP